MVRRVRQTVIELTDEQVQTLIIAALAWRFDYEEDRNGNAGFRPVEWLIPDHQQSDSDLHLLVQAGLLEVYTGLSFRDTQYFRITESGLKRVNDY
jgi:hypothetical protein